MVETPNLRVVCLKFHQLFLYPQISVNTEYAKKSRSTLKCYVFCNFKIRNEIDMNMMCTYSAIKQFQLNVPSKN